jgi:hypothetical protein
MAEQVVGTEEHGRDSVSYKVRQEFNAFMERFEAFLDKLDADGGITDDDYKAEFGDVTVVNSHEEA